MQSLDATGDKAPDRQYRLGYGPQPTAEPNEFRNTSGNGIGNYRKLSEIIGNARERSEVPKFSETDLSERIGNNPATTKNHPSLRSNLPTDSGRARPQVPINGTHGESAVPQV